MACLLTKDFTGTLGCQYALAAGIASLYLANGDEVEITKSVPTGKYDTLTMDAGKVFFKYDFSKDSASFSHSTETAEAGVRLKQTLIFTIPNYDDDIALIIKELSFAKVVAIVETRQGVRVVLGLEGTSGLEQETIEQNTGSAMSDMNGTVFTLSTFVSDPAGELEASVVIPV